MMETPNPSKDALAALWRLAGQPEAVLEAAELIFGKPEHLARILSSTEGQRQYFGDGGILGCDPLLDPLRPDARFREAMRRLTVADCPMARPLPPPPRRAP